MAEPPLKRFYTFLFVDCLYVTIRKDYETKNYAVYVILGYDVDGQKDILGLELVADSSGKHNGKTKINKRGRKRLRYLLFEAAISVVGKNEEFKEIHRYYTTRGKNPLKKMQSLIAVACKLIRVFHVILTKGVSYDA